MAKSEGQDAVMSGAGGAVASSVPFGAPATILGVLASPNVSPHGAVPRRLATTDNDSLMRQALLNAQRAAVNGMSGPRSQPIPSRSLASTSLKASLFGAEAADPLPMATAPNTSSVLSSLQRLQNLT